MAAAVQMTDFKQNSTYKAVAPYMRGGLAGMFATSCIQPIDMVKVRIQLQDSGVVNKNPLSVGAQMIKNEGVLSLYRGLSAGLLRQATYTTARMGLFNKFSEMAKDANGHTTFAKRAAAGLTAGGLGSVIGNPCDLALIRMQADATLPAAQRRGYKNVGDALVKIAKNEGILGWWRGCTPTVVRAMALNVGMLATYDQTQEFLNEKLGKGRTSNFMASAVAGFFASFFSLPFDFVKTRMQKMVPLPDGSMLYKNSLDCALKVMRNEGPLTFYNGFATYYVRIAPHAMITLLAVEYLKNYV